MGYDSEWFSTDQIPQRAVEQDIIGRFGALDPTTGGDTHRYSISGEWWLNDADHSWRAHAFVIDYGLDLWSNFTYFLDDTVDGDQFQQVDDRIIFGGGISHQSDSQLGGLAVTNRVGLEFQWDAIAEVGLHRTAERVRLSTIRSDEVDEVSLAMWWEADFTLSDRWSMILGLRADAFWADVNSKSGLSANSGSADDQIVSPSLAVIWDASETTELTLNAGLGYHSNDARGTTISVDPVSGDPVDPVDFLVQSQGLDIGVRTAFPEGLHATANVWYLGLDSEILFVGDAGTTEAAGESERIGFDLHAAYTPPALQWLSVDADLSIVDARLVDEPSDADHIPGSVPYVFTAGATAHLPRGWFTSVRLRHLGKRPLEETATVESDTSTLVNVALGFERRDLRAVLEVFNVFNSEENDIEYFYASRLAGEPAAGIEDVHFHPSEPRSYASPWKLSFNF